jgi:hypothetical protein
MTVYGILFGIALSLGISALGLPTPIILGVLGVVLMIAGHIAQGWANEAKPSALDRVAVGS